MVCILWNLSSPKLTCKKTLKNKKNLERIDKELWILAKYCGLFTFFKYLKPELVDSSILMFGNTWNWLVFFYFDFLNT